MAAASNDKIGRDGQPWEEESFPAGIIKARPGEPGHDDRINAETRRRRHRSRFEQYAYRRLSKAQINAFEWFRELCEIVAAGTLSGSRYGDDMGQIDCATYGERSVAVRVMDAARARRKCVSLINRQSNPALKALLLAADADLTPREIGDRLIKSAHIRPASGQREAEREAVALAFFHLVLALDIVAYVYTGCSKTA